MKKLTILTLLMISTAFSSQLLAQCSQTSSYATCYSNGGSYNSYFYITPNVPLNIFSEIRTGEDGGYGGIEVNYVYTAHYLHYFSGTTSYYVSDYMSATVPASGNEGQIEIWAAAGPGDYARATVTW